MQTLVLHLSSKRKQATNTIKIYPAQNTCYERTIEMRLSTRSNTTASKNNQLVDCT